jgi:Bacterial antitoxin of type II TA system, VapB
MAKEKATITIDRAKAAMAREVSGARTTSEVVDLALDQLIRAERLRADVAAYQGVPPTADERDVALLADTSGLADDTDWDQLYADDDRM